MKKIELYKCVVLTKDYAITGFDGKHRVYKAGTKGVTIDYCDNNQYVIVEINSNDYEDTIPSFPIELLEYCEK